MTKNGPHRVQVDSRIMVDATFFREMNPNYSRPKIDAAGEIKPGPPQECYDLFDGSVITIPSPHDRITGASMDPSAMTKDDLLTCCPTVFWPLASETNYGVCSDISIFIKQIC
jgi:hypothetical protein